MMTSSASAGMPVIVGMMYFLLIAPAKKSAKG